MYARALSVVGFLCSASKQSHHEEQIKGCFDLASLLIGR